MDISEFSDGEWQEIFDELRLLVQRAGYGEWDRATIESLGDDFEDGERAPFDRLGMLPPHEQLERYTRNFISFLKLRSRPIREKQAERLAAFLRTESGAPVREIQVDFEGRDLPLFEGDDDPDGMIEELAMFLSEISGESTAFWDAAAAEDEEEGRGRDLEGDA
ncbi:hypothetical protein [Novosphingobium sp. CECT 9465]|uniref:hypothetical protein n=1 Tax=Novosphingobium sp. CECT 9465 TaxID=2829794 RepID=UPI001E3648DB|nr:hypothetical protein [Novosphingobium sp. CECT 9465]CAH0496439.1 hypothetical protein NVSP9465_01473 [Novosphingobium sp. CECT 9465]